MVERFSDRIGAAPSRPLQLGSMDAPLRNSLWNALDTIITFDAGWKSAAYRLGLHFFRVPLDEVPYDSSQDWAKKWVRDRYFSLTWHDVYDLLEFIVQHAKDFAKSRTGKPPTSANLSSVFNPILERERSGYRLINGLLEPLTNEAEAKEVEAALAAAKGSGLEPVRAHLEKALTLLAQKPTPDYHNAIKEAITAVEGLANLLSGDPSSGLAKPLNELAKHVPIHAAMKEAFLKLYGYTSGKEGIRHPILEESSVGLPEAQFMIVACSAFVHFLISKAHAAGLLKDAGSR